MRQTKCGTEDFFFFFSWNAHRAVFTNQMHISEEIIHQRTKCLVRCQTVVDTKTSCQKHKSSNCM